MEAPKEIKNQQMTLKHKKYFATFIMGGASFTSFRQEHLRIMKKDVSRSTYTRIKRDSKKILDTVTHREKNISYHTENDAEKRQWESHVKEVILTCFRRKYVIKLSFSTDATILMNERKNFPNYEWLSKMEFTPTEQVMNLIERFDRIQCSDSDDE